MIVPNEILSDFRLNGTSVVKFTFENTIVSLGTDAVFSIDVSISTPQMQTDKEHGERTARFLLILSGHAEAPSAPNLGTQFHLELEGEFASSTKMEEKQFADMLLLNGTATLYSIARGKLEAFSALSYHSGKITLPMINVLELLKAKQSQAPADGSNG